ncbi:MAG: hypothetical protein JF589_04470 [Gemmatimonadetes bacterium]|nr:hypothetical protein [Gemmatimonadota bacterium]
MAAALALLWCVPFGHALAQSGIGPLDDATPIPRGWVRFSVLNSWTRFDSRFNGTGGLDPLGGPLTTDSLGARQLPLLAPVEGALQTLTNNPQQRLTFGKLVTQSDARIVTTPLVLEYGITSRLSLGVTVPVVQTRQTAQVRVNARAAGDTTKTSNMGWIPASLRATAAQQNAAVVTSLTAAATSLNGLLTRCAANPGGAGCSTIQGQEAAAAATAARATQFATAVATAYGINPQTALVAPLQGSNLATSIDAQRLALAAQLAAYLPGTQVGTLTTAATEFSYVDLQGSFQTPGLLQSTLGGGIDSIHTTDRLGVGDIEIGVRYALLDHISRDSVGPPGFQYRLVLGGVYRLATSRPDTARDLLDIGTGEGGGIEGRGSLELIGRSVGLTLAGRYAKYFARTVDASLVGYPIAGFPYPVFGQVSRTAGNLVSIAAAPRVYLNSWMSFEGDYQFEHVGAPTFEPIASVDQCSACVPPEGAVLPIATSVQRFGVGLRYSTVLSYLRHRARYPIELSYHHVETLSGDATAPKLFRDIIQLRLYYRVLR